MNSQLPLNSVEQNVPRSPIILTLERIEAKVDAILEHLTAKETQKTLKLISAGGRTPAQQANDRLILALASVDAGVQVETVSKEEGRRYGVAAAQIRAISAGATPDDIYRRADNYRHHFPDCTLTATALAKHWRRCAARPSRDQTFSMGDLGRL